MAKWSGYDLSDKLFDTGYGKSWENLGEYGICYKTHPSLKLGEYKIYGGSCISPVVLDADVYIGLVKGMRRTFRSFPWEPGDEVEFNIVDACAPRDAEGFVKLVDWTSAQLIAGRKVHVGCMGGHGRTGMLLAALTRVMTGEKDAITYVRKNYCKKAVETYDQIDFLVEVFGIKTVKAVKTYTGDQDHGGDLVNRPSD
jgi:hypothetical protein